MPSIKNKNGGLIRRDTIPATTHRNPHHIPGMTIMQARGGLPSTTRMRTMAISDMEVEMTRLDKVIDFQKNGPDKIRHASIDAHKLKELEMREEVTLCEPSCIDSRARLTIACHEAAIHRLERNNREKRCVHQSALALELEEYKKILLESLEYLSPYGEYLESSAKFLNFANISNMMIHHNSLLHTKRELTAQYENNIVALDGEKKVLFETRKFAADLELKTNMDVTEQSLQLQTLERSNKQWEDLTDVWALNTSASALLKWRETCAVKNVYTKLMTFLGEPEETTDQFEQLAIIEWRMLNLIGIQKDLEAKYFHTHKKNSTMSMASHKSDENINMSHAESLDIIAQSKHTEEQLNDQKLNQNHERLAFGTNENKTPDRQPQPLNPKTLLDNSPHRSILKEVLNEDIQREPNTADTNKEDDCHSLPLHDLLRQALHGKRKINKSRGDILLKTVLPNIETDNQRYTKKGQHKTVSFLLEEEGVGGKKAVPKSSVDKGTPFWRTTLRAERRDNEVDTCTGSDGKVNPDRLQRISSRLKQTRSVINKSAMDKAISLQNDAVTDKDGHISNVSTSSGESVLQTNSIDGLRRNSDAEHGKFSLKAFIAMRNRTLRSLHNTPGPIPRRRHGIHDNKVALRHTVVPSLRHRADAILRNTSVPTKGDTVVPSLRHRADAILRNTSVPTKGDTASFQKLDPRKDPWTNKNVSRSKFDAESLPRLREAVFKKHVAVLKMHDAVPKMDKAVPRLYKANYKTSENKNRKDEAIPLLSSAVSIIHKTEHVLQGKLSRDLPTLLESGSKQRKLVSKQRESVSKKREILSKPRESFSKQRATKRVANDKALNRNRNTFIKRAATCNEAVPRVYLSDLTRRKNNQSLETIWETSEVAQT